MSEGYFINEKIDYFFPLGVVLMQNRSHEDFHVSCRIGRDCQFHAVFDGHGGGNKDNLELQANHVALYIHKYLVHHLIYSLQGISYDNEALIKEAIIKSFEEVDRHLHSSGATSGATCCCVLVLPKRIIVCNLGDSQLYAFKGNKIKFSTTAHNAVSEEARIKSNGGYVVRGRLNGIYLPSRSFGDFQAKTRGKAYFSPAPMGIVPDITFLPREDYDFLILATDGITDGIPNKETVEKIVRESKKRNLIVDDLAKIAAKNNGKDDIACLLIDL